MQINFTLDTNQPGDIIALRKLSDAFSGETHTLTVTPTVEFTRPAEEPATPPAEKPAKKVKPAVELSKSAQSGELPTPPAATEPAPKPEKAERVTIEQVRMAIQTKNIDDCKKVLAGMGVKALADAPAELLPDILTAINELPSK